MSAGSSHTGEKELEYIRSLSPNPSLRVRLLTFKFLLGAMHTKCVFGCNLSQVELDLLTTFN